MSIRWTPYWACICLKLEPHFFENQKRARIRTFLYVILWWILTLEPIKSPTNGVFVGLLGDFDGICLVFCDPAGTRTQDPYIKSVLLYQLSYGI